MINKIKDFIEEVKKTIDWIVAGMPEPIPIEVKENNEK